MEETIRYEPAFDKTGEGEYLRSAGSLPCLPPNKALKLTAPCHVAIDPW
jgi:hypothetical protein